MDRGARALDILCGIERLRRVDEVDHVIAHSPSLFVAGLVGGDVKALVDLARVGDHDLAVETHRQLERDARLSDAGGSDDNRDGSQLSTFCGSPVSTTATPPGAESAGRAGR